MAFPARPGRLLPMDPLFLQFGRNVGRARKRAGLTQDELQKLCGIHASEISRIEKGARNVTIKTVARLAQVLGVTPGQLLDGRLDQVTGSASPALPVERAVEVADERRPQPAPAAGDPQGLGTPVEHGAHPLVERPLGEEVDLPGG